MIRQSRERLERLARGGDREAAERLHGEATRRGDRAAAAQAALGLGEPGAVIDLATEAWEADDDEAALHAGARLGLVLDGATRGGIDAALRAGQRRLRARRVGRGEALSALHRARVAPGGVGLAWSAAPGRGAGRSLCLAARLGEGLVVGAGRAPRARSTPDSAWPELQPWGDGLDADVARMARWAEATAADRVRVRCAAPPPSFLSARVEATPSRSQARRRQATTNVAAARRRALDALLMAEPGEAVWRRLLEHLERWPEDDDPEGAHRRATAALDARWPDALRVADERWTQAACGAPAPWRMALYRRLHLVAREPEALDALTTASAQSLRALDVRRFERGSVATAARWAAAWRAVDEAGQLRALDDLSAQLDPLSLARVLDSDALCHLQTLSVQGATRAPSDADRARLAAELGARGARRRAWPRLRALTLWGMPLEEAPLEALAQTAMPALTTLTLHACEAFADALGVLLDPSRAPSLTQLTLSHSALLTPQALQVAPPELRRLSLRAVWLDAAAARTLAAWPGLAQLEWLEVSGHGLTTEDLAALLCALDPARLRCLRLDLAALTPDVLERLCASPGLTSLQALCLGPLTRLGDVERCAQALSGAPFTATLRLLQLQRGWLNPSAHRRLLERLTRPLRRVLREEAMRDADLQALITRSDA